MFGNKKGRSTGPFAWQNGVLSSARCSGALEKNVVAVLGVCREYISTSFDLAVEVH